MVGLYLGKAMPYITTPTYLAFGEIHPALIGFIGTEHGKLSKGKCRACSIVNHHDFTALRYSLYQNGVFPFQIDSSKSSKLYFRNGRVRGNRFCHTCLEYPNEDDRTRVNFMTADKDSGGLIANGHSSISFFHDHIEVKVRDLCSKEYKITYSLSAFLSTLLQSSTDSGSRKTVHWELILPFMISITDHETAPYMKYLSLISRVQKDQVEVELQKLKFRILEKKLQGVDLSPLEVRLDRMRLIAVSLGPEQYVLLLVSRQEDLPKICVVYASMKILGGDSIVQVADTTQKHCDFGTHYLKITQFAKDFSCV